MFHIRTMEQRELTKKTLAIYSLLAILLKVESEQNTKSNRIVEI